MANSVRVYSYEELRQELLRPETILLDVRSADEIKYQGKIAGSINLHIAELKHAMKMTDEGFRDKYGFDMPPRNAHIICHDRGGMRGQRAGEILKEEYGYTDVSAYAGIVDWVERGGSIIPPTHIP